MTVLTRRELQALKILAQGKRDMDVAEELGISPRTAQKHANSAFDKFGAATRFQAGMFYERMVRG